MANCRLFKMGRIVAWDELSLGTHCRFLEFGTNLRLGRIVALRKKSPQNRILTENSWTLVYSIPRIDCSADGVLDEALIQCFLIELCMFVLFLRYLEMSNLMF